MYVKIEKFFQSENQTNNISSVILLINFLVYQCDPRHLQGSCVVYIFVFITKFAFNLVSNHIFVSIKHKDILLISDVLKDLSSLRMKIWNWEKSTISLIMRMIKTWKIIELYLNTTTSDMFVLTNCFRFPFPDVIDARLDLIKFCK